MNLEGFPKQQITTESESDPCQYQLASSDSWVKEEVIIPVFVPPVYVPSPSREQAPGPSHGTKHDQGGLMACGFGDQKIGVHVLPSDHFCSGTTKTATTATEKVITTSCGLVIQHEVIEQEELHKLKG